MFQTLPTTALAKGRTKVSLALWLFGPIATIVALLVASSLHLIWTSAKQIDAIQGASERTLAKTAFATLVDPIDRSTQDYSFWDETYDQTKRGVDLEWAEGNLGPYLAKTYGVTHLFVLDARGGLRYASVQRANGQAQFVSDQAPELKGLVTDDVRNAAARALTAALSGDISGLRGFTTFMGTTAYLAARPIRPDSDDRAKKDLPIYAMVALKVLAEEDIRQLSESFALEQLRVSKDFRVALPSLNNKSNALGATWFSRRTGTQFVSEAMRAVLPLVVIAVILILLSAIGWFRAFSEVRNAELLALAERAKSVQETARAKSLFVANMSHELRTPLNAIIGFSEVIKGQMLGPLTQPKYLEYASDIHASGKHLLGIVNNILTLSKIEAQQQRIQIEDVSVADVLFEALRMITPDAAKRRVRIETDFVSAPVVRADAQALVQIAINLLSNAVKFSKPDSTVTVKVAEGAGRVILTVSDQGCGIPAETLAQLGRPFTQAEDPFRRNYQGTGLGLSICFALARHMDGELRIQSEEGKGTVGTLELPGAAAVTEATPAPRAA